MHNNKYNFRCAILMATCNGVRFLNEQIQSIQSQYNCSVNIYFSDDISSDDTRRILIENNCIDLNDDKVKFGSAASNFFGLIENFSIADQFDFIALADQDDIWLPNKLNAAIERLISTQSGAYSGSYYSYYPDQKKIKYRNKKFTQTSNSHLFRSPGPGFTFVFDNNTFKLLREDVIKYQEVLPKVKWHDWFLFALVIARKVKWYIDENPYTLYRQHEKNDTGQLDSIKQLKFRLNFLFNGFYRQQVMLISKVNDMGEISHFFQRFSILDRFKLIRFVPQMRCSISERVVLLFWLMFGK